MNQSTVLEKAAALWLELWELAGEKWPPDNVALAWRLYERLKRRFIGLGMNEAQAITFCDEFFRGAQGWGSLTLVSNHRRPIDALTVTLIDVEMAEMGIEQPAKSEP